ncbi:MAG: Wzz/FepE/Etk N-terminal domain-containing protein, partial [bacterium]
METTPKPLGLNDYIAIGLRRKWFIIIPFIAAVFISFGVYKYLPKIYKATTLILVQPQRVPETYVRPTITASIGERLNTISQEILSRTRLEKIIQEFNLYPELR